MTETARVSARSTSIEFSKKYGTKYCIPTWLRDAQIKAACEKVAGRFETREEVRSDPVAVVGYGPSLKETWEQIKGFKHVITCSGAHKFLIERGIVPTWHVEVDPRAHKIKLLGDAHKDVIYLPSSTSHPDYLDHLLKSGATVNLWHVFTQDDGMRVIPPKEWAVTGGADAGLRAMVMARLLGFVDIHVFGIDGCGGESSHADKHPNSPGKMFDCEFPEGSGKFWKTTPALLSCAKSVPHEVDQIKDAKFTFYGDGLIQEMMKHHTPKKPKEGVLALMRAEVISDSYKELNAKLHRDNPMYGVSGAKYVDTVLKLAQSLKTQSVLDYGCGKGLLARGLPFPIWEYDPAIEGKDELPRAAELVVCTDVLEHIEPEMLRSVLLDLVRVTRKVGYFVVHTGPAAKTLADGRNAHLIQKSADWWIAKLGAYFSIGKAFKAGDTVHFVVAPKKPKEKPVVVEVVKKPEPRWKSFVRDLFAVVKGTVFPRYDYRVRERVA